MTPRVAGSMLPRLLTIMGSGETAPTMAKVHREVVGHLDPGTARGVLLDTPFGFQTNAEQIANRAVSYFRESVGVEVDIAHFGSAADLSGPGGDRIVTSVANEGFVFAGPGSPTYALRNWSGTVLPSLLSERLALGGPVTFASAAALTLGAWTVPVYEIYKVGEEPRWVEGLDLLGPLGLQVALIPHYDNAEGGTYDTRYCYLGEDRLSEMEAELPEEAFVLGVDEHTALILELAEGIARVAGNGAVTVRAAGRSSTIAAGATVPLDGLVELAAELRSIGRSGGSASVGGTTGATGGDPSPAPAPPPVAHEVQGAGWATEEREHRFGTAVSPLRSSVRGYEERFAVALAERDAAAMADAVVGLQDELSAWEADTLQSDDLDRGRAASRYMLAELAKAAAIGVRDPALVVGPYVEAILSFRDSLRAEHRFAWADAVRDELVRLGVELHDGPE